MRWAQYLGGARSRRQDLDRPCSTPRCQCCHALLRRLRVDARCLVALVARCPLGCNVCVRSLLLGGSLEGDASKHTKDVSYAFMSMVVPPSAFSSAKIPAGYLMAMFSDEASVCSS